MNKLVILKLDGDFHDGFRVSLEIGEDGALPDIELSDNTLKLPPLPTLPNIYQDWSKSYRSLDGYRIKPKKDQITNVRFQSLKTECHTHTDILKQQFITWLQAESFRRIQELCLTQLTTVDEVRVIIRTNETQLRKLPWHLWDLFDYYPHAEVAFSSLSSQRFKRSHRSHIRILIILGNSEGINVVEDEKLLQQYCQAAEIIVLVEPSPSELNQHLWDDTGWDLIFFSGHSRTELTKGRIFLNRTDSLTMDELRYGLQTAVSKGLQLAFFNSCDGLGIAAELESLHIPQIIVMREPVPDKVAHQFLKDFIQQFTSRKSFYQSVNIARKKLQGLETEYPCASWLPVIVQNLLATPPTWQSMGAVASCPYRGLSAFQEQDAAYFYGREIVTQQLVAAVKTKHLVAVVGASGSGKSSVVFAGLIPQLKRDKSQHWQIVSFRPGNNPLESLAIAISAADIALHQELGIGKDISPNSRLQELELEVQLKQIHSTLSHFLESLISISPQSHIVLIADQFEELYTLCQDTAERQIFLDNLLNAVSSVPGFTLVLTLRADFFGEALSYRPLSNALQDAQVNLSAMNVLELESAIAQPALSLNIQLEPGLTQRLIDVVLNSPSHLPLLEFTLTQLWQRQQQGWLTHQAYKEIGTIETALANHAESIYAQLSKVDQQKVQQIFIQLVQPGEFNADIRRLATRGEVGEENWNLVTQLANARLVVTDINKLTKIETVEIIHEALIRNWRRLKQWMQTDGDFRRWQEQLRTVMRQWENNQKDTGALLRGKSLIEAQEWLRQRENQISTNEQNFIIQSLELQNKESQAKNAARNRIIMALSGGLLGALLLAGVALWQRQQAQINELKALNLSAQVLLKSGDEVAAFIPTLKVIKNLEQLHFLDSQTKLSLSAATLENIKQIREYNRLQGHKGEISTVKFSLDSQFLASGSEDTTIKIWRRDGKLQQTLSGHQDRVFSVVFSPDNQFLIAASFDNTISFWHYDSSTKLFTNQPTFELAKQDGLLAISLSPNGEILATANSQGQVKLWTLNGQLIKTFTAHKQKVLGVSFSPDGQTIATASADKTIKLWNLEGKELKTLPGHNDEVLAVKFSPDGNINILASASKDKTVKLWDINGQLLHTFEGHNNHVLDVNFSPDGKTIISASADDTVKVWMIPNDLKNDLNKDFTFSSQLPIYTFLGHGDKASEASFSPDGKTIVSASADGTIKLSHLQGILPNFSGSSVSFSPDGNTVAVSNKQGIISLRKRDGSLIKSFYAHEGEIVKVLFHPTGNNIITIGVDNQIKLWNLDGKLIKSWQGHLKDNNSMFEPIQDISFSPDGNKIATISRVDKQVKIWDLQGNLLKSWQTNDKLVTNINFSRDGQTLATAGDKTVKLWNLEGNLLQTISGHKENIASVSFSSDGKIIATGSADSTVKLWDRKSGKLLHTLQHHESVRSVNFSPDSKILVSASGDKISFWNLQGELIYSLLGNKDILSEVNFSPDGKMIASVDISNHITLWDLDIDTLQKRSCDWLNEYLKENVNLVKNEDKLCENNR